jgi:hypothetical protein
MRAWLGHLIGSMHGTPAMKLAGLALALACCVAGGFAQAAEEGGPRTYAVMSLIGDSFSISPYMDVSSTGASIYYSRGSDAAEAAKSPGGWGAHGGMTGSRLVQDRVLTIPVKEPVFDDAAIASVAGVLKQREPGTTVELLRAKDPNFYNLQDQLVDSPSGAKEAREALRTTLKERKAAYLILVTKHRSKSEMLGDAHVFSDAQLQVLSGSRSDTRRLEGLGFYVDDLIRVQNLKTLERSTGVLASYVNATVRLVDAKSLEVIREVTITRSKIIAAARPLAAGFTAWDEATDAQRAQALQALVRAAMEEATGNLMNKSP